MAQNKTSKTKGAEPRAQVKRATKSVTKSGSKNSVESHSKASAQTAGGYARKGKGQAPEVAPFDETELQSNLQQIQALLAQLPVPDPQTLSDDAQSQDAQRLALEGMLNLAGVLPERDLPRLFSAQYWQEHQAWPLTAPQSFSYPAQGNAVKVHYFTFEQLLQDYRILCGELVQRNAQPNLLALDVPAPDTDTEAQAQAAHGYAISPQYFMALYRLYLEHEARYRHSDLRSQEQQGTMRQELFLRRLRRPLEQKQVGANSNSSSYLEALGAKTNCGSISYNAAEFVLEHRAQLGDDSPALAQLKVLFRQFEKALPPDYGALLNEALWPSIAHVPMQHAVSGTEMEVPPFITVMRAPAVAANGQAIVPADGQVGVQSDWQTDTGAVSNVPSTVRNALSSLRERSLSAQVPVSAGFPAQGQRQGQEQWLAQGQPQSNPQFGSSAEPKKLGTGDGTAGSTVSKRVTPKAAKSAYARSNDEFMDHLQAMPVVSGYDELIDEAVVGIRKCSRKQWRDSPYTDPSLRAPTAAQEAAFAAHGSEPIAAGPLTERSNASIVEQQKKPKPLQITREELARRQREIDHAIDSLPPLPSPPATASEDKTEQSYTPIGGTDPISFNQHPASSDGVTVDKANEGPAIVNNPKTPASSQASEGNSAQLGQGNGRNLSAQSVSHAQVPAAVHAQGSTQGQSVYNYQTLASQGGANAHHSSNAQRGAQQPVHAYGQNGAGAGVAQPQNPQWYQYGAAQGYQQPPMYAAGVQAVNPAQVQGQGQSQYNYQQYQQYQQQVQQLQQQQQQWQAWAQQQAQYQQQMQQQQQQQSPYSQAQAVYNNAAGTQQGQWRQGPHAATQPQPAYWQQHNPAHLQQQGQYQMPASSSSGANAGAGGAQPQGNYGYGHNAGAQQTLGAVNQQGQSYEQAKAQKQRSAQTAQSAQPAQATLPVPAQKAQPTPVGPFDKAQQSVAVEQPEYDRTESDESLKCRQEQTIKISREIGLIITDEVYKTYCERMAAAQLKPFTKEYLIKLNLVRVFGPKGYLALKLPNYSMRLGQLLFTDQVEIAVAQKKMLMVEAGTGTGKTFSYLLPPILGDRLIVVSTATKALQDQLMRTDLPNLSSMLDVGDHLHYIAIKGQANYVCRYLLDGKDGTGLIADQDIERLQKFVDEEIRALEKDLYHANFGELRFKLEDHNRAQVTCDSQLCRDMSHTCPYAKKKCEFLKGEQKGTPVYIEPDEHCFVFMLRQEAKKRDVVAINHALFFASLMMEDRNALLPKPDVMIFDEAHTLPDVCRNFFSRRMVQEGLEEIPTLVHEAFKGTSVSTNSGAFLDCLTTYANCLNILARFLSTYRIPSHSKEQFLRLPIQRLKYKHRAQPTPFQLLGSLLLLPNEVERLGEKSLLLKAIKEEGGRGGQSASDVAKGLLGQDDSILSATGSVAEKALDQYRAAAASNKLSARNYNSVAETLAQIYYDRLLEYRRERGIPEDYSDIGRGGTPDYEADLVCNDQGVPEAEPLFRALMVDFWKALRDLNQLLSDNKEVCSDMSKISPLITACAELSNFVSDFMNSDRDKQGQQHWDFVSWVEISEKNYVLQLAPVDVSTLLGEALRTLHQQGVTTVFTSATITVDRQFTKFCHDIGLKQDELMLQIVDSPFDYQNQACLMVSSDFPKPEDPLRINKCIAQIRDAIEASPGGVFFLTTSHGSMRQAYEELTRCFGRKRQVLMQGTDSIPNLMAKFKSDGNAILVGTSSFWEGVDVPGKALSLVVIDKLPFKQLNDPVLVARAKRCEMQGGNFFTDELLPDAIIKLRQGVGRLIRNEQDTGALIILDPRVLTKSYGQKVLNSLPPMRRVNHVADVVSFFRNLRS